MPALRERVAPRLGTNGAPAAGKTIGGTDETASNGGASRATKGTAAVRVWAIDDGVKIDPVSGDAWEARWAGGEVLPGYREKNWVWDGATQTVTLHAARNEVVAFQVIIEGPARRIQVSVSSLTGPADIPADHIQCFRQWSVRNRVAPERFAAPNSLGDGWIPDGLVPIRAVRYGEPVNVPDDINGIPDQTALGLWFDVYVPTDAPPGDYEGALEVAGDAGGARLTLRLKVYPVTIPDTVNLHIPLNTFGELERPGRDAVARLTYYQLAHRHRCFVEIDSFNREQSRPTFDRATGTITDWEAFDRFFGGILDGSAFTASAGYRPGPRAGRPTDFFFLPFAINTPRTDLPGNQKTTWWPIPHDEVVTPAGTRTWIDTLQAFDRHFAERRWDRTMIGVFLNGLDEPLSEEAWRHVMYYGNLVRRSTTGFVYRADTYCLAEIGSRIPGWTPDTLFAEAGQVVNLFIFHTGEPGMIVFDREAIARWQAGGRDRRIWSCSGQVPWTGGVSVCHEAVGPRVLAWMADAYGLDGFHPSWEYVWGHADAWSAETNDEHSYAWFVYPEETASSDGHGVSVPVPSIRLKNIRRGAQDYELLRLLRRGGRTEQADAIRRSVFRMGLDEVARVYGLDHHAGEWSHNPADWHAARVRLLEALTGL